MGTMIHYPIPPHLQAAYADLGLGEGSLLISEQIHAEALSLPLHPHLTDEQQDRVISACVGFSTNRAGAEGRSSWRESPVK